MGEVRQPCSRILSFLDIFLRCASVTAPFSAARSMCVRLVFVVVLVGERFSSLSKVHSTIRLQLFRRPSGQGSERVGPIGSSPCWSRSCRKSMWDLEFFSGGSTAPVIVL